MKKTVQLVPRNGKNMAMKMLSEIMAEISSYTWNTGHDPDHITISVDDYFTFGQLCVATRVYDEKEGCKDKILGIDCSISRNLKRGEFVLGNKHKVDESLYFEPEGQIEEGDKE